MKTIQRFVLFVILLAGFVIRLQAQVVINEISSNNYNTFPDNDGDFEDWIELYNTGASPVNLTGYHITDNPLVPAKWALPSLSMPAGSYLTLFASNKNRVDFIDHWESLVLENNSWKYTVPSAEISNWQLTSFDDAAWSTGNGGLGYADSDDGTTVTPNPFLTLYARRTFNVVDAAAIKSMILYMDYDDGFVAYLNGVEIARGNMSVASPLYNTPADNDREAVMYGGGNPEKFTISNSAFQSILVTGTNVLAIEIHNKSATSSDLTMRPFLVAGIASATVSYQTLPSWFTPPAVSGNLHTNFKLKAGGQVVQLYDGTNTLINSVSAPALGVDDTYGRFPNGSATLKILQPATPNASNGTATAITGYWNDPVTFSLPAGFYSGTQTVTLTKSNAASTIRYTTDGTKPTASSPTYTGPISVTANTVIRAASFNAGYVTATFETNTYFINQSVTLPVFSISTAPANFFSSATGIYVDGPSSVTSQCPDDPHTCYNYWQDWEREIHIEFFDKGKAFQFEQDAGVKILGGWTRTMRMKSLQVRAGEQYGKKTIEYPFFDEPEKAGLTKFETITLRNGGNDFNQTHIRDAVNHRVLNSMPCIENNVDFEAYTPVVVFINGQYWGVHTLRERVDDSYFENNTGLTDDEIDLCEFDGDPKKGTNTEFLAMVNYISNNDLTVSSNYAAVKSMLDIENYVDYMAAELFHTNWDWPHNNIKFWQPRAAGGKWRYIYHDTDFSWGLFNFSSPTSNELNRVLTDTRSLHSAMFAKLLTNTEFKNYFINRNADLMNTIYQPSNIKKIYDQLKTEIEPEMGRHFAKWNDFSGDVTGWNNAITGVKGFIDARLSPARSHIQSKFSLSGQTTVTLDVLPAGAGKIVISTITPCDLPWTGVYFRGVPVVVKVIANPGYNFVNWTVAGVTLSSTTAMSNTVTFSGSTASFTANFTATSSIPKLVFTEINYQSDTIAANNSNSGDWIELHNYGNASIDLSGWKIKDSKIYNSFVIPNGTTLAPGQYLVFVNDVAKFQAVNPTVTNYLGSIGFNLSNDGETISLYDLSGTKRLSVTYNDAAPWPSLANGKGSSMELVSNTSDMNLPASWFDGCRKGSPGKGYVSCPCMKPNLGQDAVLCLTGSSKVLNSGLAAHPNRKFSWFLNGTKIITASGPTYSATVAGTYTVTVDSSGCVQNDAMRLDADLTFDLGPDIALCSPAIDTLNSRLTATGITYAWYKGTTLITGQSSSKLVVSTPATYELRVTGGSCAQKTDQVVVTSAAAATPVDAARCGAGTVNLSVNGIAGKTYKWYPTKTGGSSLTTGTTYTTPSLNTTTTYYVEDASFIGGIVGPVDTTFGNNRAWVDDHHTNSPYRLIFNVTKACMLNYITVYAAGPQNVKINMYASNGTTVLATRTVPVSAAGPQRIPLGFSLTVGNGYYMDAVGTTGELYYNNDNASYPYTESGGYISIVNTSPSWVGPTNKWYPYLYKWEFANGVGPCDRIPVTATIQCVLPVDLIGFRATRSSDDVYLTWNTVKEEQFAYFTVMRSDDGKNFESIGKVNGSGNSTNIKTYSFIDKTAPLSTVYYKLVMIDTDGKSESSEVISISVNETILSVFPNPYTERFVVNLSGPQGDVYQIRITDLSGKDVLILNDVQMNQVIELGEELSRGMYILNVQSSSLLKSVKIQKL